MGRIRTIKPEFPQSETVGRLSRDGRLLFIQLWTVVDDDGRARAASRMLASLLYPYDDDAPRLMDGWLAELEAAGCIRRYTAEGSQYLEVVNWLKHQKIDKPSKSKIPSFDDSSSNPREASTTDLGPRKGTKEEDLGARTSARARLDAIQVEISEAAGESPCASDPDISPIVRLLDAGWSLEGHVLPGIRDLARRESRPGSWKYVAKTLLGRASDIRAQGPPPAAAKPETASDRIARKLKAETTANGDESRNPREVH